MANAIEKFPAPWNLKGKGYIIIYKLKKSFVEEEGNVPPFLQGSFKGGFGAVMLVDYQESNAGPYGEFLFIPGKFRYQGRKLDTISKIYVSSMESVVNGRENWGIPKDLADFKFEKKGKHGEMITIRKDGDLVAKFEMGTGRIPFPVSTRLMPFPLVQHYEGKDIYTNFFGKGVGRLARIRKIRVNSRLFPDISRIHPVAVVKVEPFDITFPEARISS